MSDEITPQEMLDNLDSEFQGMQNEAALNRYKDSMGEIDQTISGLTQKIVEIRERGYRYKSYLEGKVETLASKWKTSKPAMKRAIDSAEKELMETYDEIAKQISNLQRSSSSSRLKAEVDRLQSQVDSFRGRINSANTTIDATYAAVNQAMWQTDSQVRQVVWILDEVDQASFPLLAGENVIQAVKAKWWRDGNKKGPDGVLYISDQRLVFEQKEEVATKKVLFVATEKETVQEMLFEAPVTSIESVKSSSKGVFGHQDHLDIEFGSGSEYGNAHFHIDGQESDWWVALIKRIGNGDIMKERFFAEGEELAEEMAVLEESLANAPEKCSSCGAPFDEPIAKGQRQIACEYCGTSMRW